MIGYTAGQYLDTLPAVAVYPARGILTKSHKRKILRMFLVGHRDDSG
jgi:hypothetical protein